MSTSTNNSTPMTRVVFSLFWLMACSFLRSGASCAPLQPLQTGPRSQDAEFHILRGQALLDKGQNEQARLQFKEALTLDADSIEARYQLGLSQWKLGQYSEASVNLRKVLELDSSHQAAAYYLGRIALQLNDLRGALGYFEKVARAGKKTPLLDEYYQLGKLYMSATRLEDAIGTLEEGSRLQPRDDRIHTQLAKAYTAAGRKADAEKALARSQQLHDYQREATQLLLLCAEHLKAHRVEEALAIFQRFLHSDDVDDLVSLGINFGQSELFDQAVTLLTRAIDLAPNNFEAHYNLGLMFLRTQRPDQAEQHLSRAATLKPYSFDANSLLGVILSQRGQNEAAIKVLERAHALKSDDSKVTTLLALQFVEGRYYSEAARMLERVTKVWPDNLDLRLLLIQTYHRDRKYERAVQEARQTLARFPQSARANFEMGFQLSQFGQFKESETYLKRAIQLDPQLSEAHSSLGDTLMKEGRYEEAVQCFRHALVLDDRHVDSYLGLAKSLLSLQRYPEVVAEMERAIQLDPGNPQPHLHLSQALLSLGDKDRANQEAETFKLLNKQQMLSRDQEAGRELQRE